MNLFEYIEQNTLRLEASHRGGGIEVSLDDYRPGLVGGKMSAYQNYLGGGMLGAVASDCNIRGWEQSDDLRKLSEALKRYYYNITNGIVEDWDEWAASTSFELHQATRPVSYPGL